MHSHESEPTPAHVLAVFRRRAPLVVLCLVVAVGATLGYSLHTQKEYTATASLLFNTTPLSQQIAGLPGAVNPSQQSQQDTNTQLLQLGDLAQKTANRVGLTKQAVADSLSINAQGDTTVVNVASTMPSPSLAAQVANTYVTIFVNEQQSSDHHYYSSALATIDTQLARLSPQQATGPQGLSLQTRAQSLATLAQLRSDTVRLAQAATVPTVPSSPRITRNLMAAGLLGLLLGVALALGIERLDQRIREPEDLENAYGLPLLGAVPASTALRRGSRGSRSGRSSSSVADTFRFIRARLRYFNVDRELQTLAIVSALPGDGKTTVAHRLADAAAAAGSRVLLIEADLRRPTMGEQVDLRSGPGLADVLIGASTFDEATQRVGVVTFGKDRGAGRTLDVIVAGALPPNPAEMLESQAMARVLEQAKSSYDFVVIDTPPLGAVSDALPLVREVDGVAIVASLGRNRRDVAKRIRATLESVDAPLLGVIANRVKARGGALYGYGFGYGYESKRVSGSGEPVVATAAHDRKVPTPGIKYGAPLRVHDKQPWEWEEPVATGGTNGRDTSRPDVFSEALSREREKHVTESGEEVVVTTTNERQPPPPGAVPDALSVARGVDGAAIVASTSPNSRHDALSREREKHVTESGEEVVMTTANERQPPTPGAVSEALPVAREVDDVAIVAGTGRNRRAVAKRLRATLATVGAPLLEVIADRAKARAGTLYAYTNEDGYGNNRVPDSTGAAGATRANGRVPAERSVPPEVRVSEPGQ